MNVVVDIAADLEPRLLEQAAKCGVDPGQYIASVVRTKLKDNAAAAHRLDAEQSRLIEEINRGLSAVDWHHYYSLVAKRRSESLSDDEHAKLAALTDRIEELNARRMEQLAELARLRGVSLPDLLDGLGVAPPAVI